MTSSPGSESMVCLDRALRIRQVNQEFFTRFGLAPDDEFRGLVHPSLWQAVHRGLTGLTEGGRHRFSAHVVLLDATGVPTPATLTAVSVCDAGGVTTVLVVLHPVSDTDAEVVTGKRKILSEMDARILEGIAAGTSTIPLASRLFLSRQGVEYRVSGLLRKLKVPNRAALVSRAYSLGVLNVGSWPPKVVDDFVK